MRLCNVAEALMRPEVLVQVFFENRNAIRIRIDNDINACVRTHSLEELRLTRAQVIYTRLQYIKNGGTDPLHAVPWY